MCDLKAWKVNGMSGATINIKDLKHLKLRAMECLENTIRTILLRNSNTLRSLELGWILLSDSDTSLENCLSWIPMSCPCDLH